MAAPEKVLELVERFERNLASYKRGQYNETQVRVEFIDPFFEELGWDIANKQGLAEAYKDVIHEDQIKVSAGTKAPDYCFRIGGVRKFFLEAKKPSIDIFKDTHPAYQLRRYAWSAKLPLSILTDFEEFAVYDCRIRPVSTDKASTARDRFVYFTDYESRWNEISDVFSKDAILKGSFDSHVDKTKAKRGTAEVDEVFLGEIEKWRELLARNIALRNPELSQRELNFAVQLTIDRIIFLRICEDRGIEEYGRLMSLLNGSDTYLRLFQYFRQADDRYNSGLFHFRLEKGRPAERDELTPGLEIDDNAIKSVIKNIYYPDSPYEFSVLPPEILGQVYEQFLGKVIRLTTSHHAKVEFKPEVRKAGGVYYTPAYIVNYIVKKTVEKVLEGKKPGPKGTAGKIKILDPACGSGSFLLGAYQYLLDWHLKQYSKESAKWTKGTSPRIYEFRKGEWRLTTEERKRILLDHIYGVDIDPQAVEVTKLSLLLKVLELEHADLKIRQLSLLHKRVLPDLSNNIKCGNSLIGTDYDRLVQKDLFDQEEAFKINAFDWQKEFPDIMESGGFDAVIGNPPYVRQETLGEQKGYFQQHYRVYHGVADLYVYFIEKGLSLLKKGSFFGIIVANKWLRANYGLPLRQLLKTQNIQELIDFGDLPVFKQATTYPCILIVQKNTPSSVFSAATVQTLDFTSLPEYVAKNSFQLRVSTLDDLSWNLGRESVQALLNKIRNVGVPLGEYVKGEIYRGILTGLNEAFIIDQAMKDSLVAEDPLSAELIKPFLVGGDLKRYQSLPVNKRYLIFTRRGIDIKKYRAIEKYLSQFKERLIPRPKDWKEEKWLGRKPGHYKWYEIQDTISYYQKFTQPKIFFPDISARGNFTIDETGGVFCVNTVYFISVADKYLLGLLNSRLLDFFYRNILASYRGGYLRFIYQYMVKIPIVITATKQSHQKLISLVENMLSLHEQLASVREPQERTILQRSINSIDDEIDNVVYEIYGLNSEEIKIIEQSS